MTARWTLAALCAWFGCGLPVMAAAPDGALLRYRFRAGQVLTYKVTMDLQAGLGTAAKPPGPSATARTGTNRIRVLSVDRAGTARVRSVQTTALAGNKPGAPTTLNYTITALGRVRGVTAVGQKPPQLLGAALDADALALMQAPLPQGRVRQGAVWTAGVASPFRGARPLSIRSRLVRLAAGRSARIQQAYTIPVDVTTYQGGQPVRVTGKVAMRGVTDINLATGTMQSSSVSGSGMLSVSFAAATGQAEQPPSVRLTIKTTMRRI